MSKFASAMAQTAKIAEETAREMKVKPAPEQQPIPPVPEGSAEVDPVQAVDAVTTQPHEATPSQPEIAAASQPRKAVKPAPVKRTSTSLYLSPEAHKVLRIHAAKVGVRSNRIYEDALRAYFKEHKLGDFDKINKTAL